MSRKTSNDPNPNADAEMWAKLLEDIKAEDAANPNLTDEEKRLLEQLEEWEPIECKGKPVSETIIEDRGERW